MMEPKLTSEQLLDSLGTGIESTAFSVVQAYWLD